MDIIILEQHTMHRPITICIITDIRLVIMSINMAGVQIIFINTQPNTTDTRKDTRAEATISPIRNMLPICYPLTNPM